MTAQARRDQFVEAAVKVMAREGLERATTRRIAEEAGAPHGSFHYAFRDKNELLTAVIGAVTKQVEQVLRDAVDPRRGLATAIHDGMYAYWRHVISDDGLQLMQYELTIFCRRTAGYEWLAEWQYARYAASSLDLFLEAAKHDPQSPDVPLTDLVNFITLAMDGLIIRYEVTHDLEGCERDLQNVIRAAVLIGGLRPLAEPDSGGS
jgi:AcrR family transcriptional regulator